MRRADEKKAAAGDKTMKERMSYVDDNQLLKVLVEGYKPPTVTSQRRALTSQNCGPILQELLRKDIICQKALNNSAIFPQFFDFVQLPNFEDSSIAFQTFKVFMFRHKMVRDCFVEYLQNNDEPFFKKYHELIQCNNYVTRRQSLSLLGEILLDRKNFSVMMKYINNKKNLQLMMRLLKANSKAIQFEAFHIFKVFIANPKKNDDILKILRNNKGKLINFLEKFQNDKEDEQFVNEKQILINHLQDVE